MENKFKLISFDVWGTLLKSNPNFVKSRGELFADVLNCNDLIYLKSIKDEVDLELDGKAENTGIDSNFKDRMKLMIEKLSKNPEDFSEDFFDNTRDRLKQLFLDNLPELIEPNTLELFKELKKRNIKIALISNTGFLHGDVMRLAFSKLGILDFIDYAIFSNEVGVSKPHPDIYKELVKQSGISFDEIIHIGDSIKADYLGAKKVGIHSVLFDPKQRHGDRMFSIKNINNILKIIDEEESILHYDNLSLYSLRVENNSILDQYNKPFDLVSYSKFKYGDGKVAREYGHKLAEKFIETYTNLFDLEDKIEMVITTSPYKNIVKGSSGIVRGFKNYINQYLLNKGKTAVFDITILKNEMFEGDYGTFTDEQRKELMNKNDLFIMEELIKDKTLILIDDARITGSHEKNLITFLKNKSIKEAYFIYIADMESSFATEHPDIESVMNHGWVDSLDKLLNIMELPEFILNARVCKYILSKHSSDEDLKLFLGKLKDNVLYDLYNGIVGDGYASMALYKDSFQILEKELENRKMLCNNKLLC